MRCGPRWDADRPAVLAWPLRNDRAVVALAATMTAVVWHFVEPIVVTYDTFAYLTAAKYIAGVEGGSFTYFRPPRQLRPKARAEAMNSPIAIKPSDLEILRRHSCIRMTDAMPRASCARMNQT